MIKLDEKILPTNDLVFRKIFTSKGNENIIAGLVRDFCGIEANSVTVLNPYDIKTYKVKDYAVIGEHIHDVLAVIDGVTFAMEMQNSKGKYDKERFMLYISNAYQQSFSKDSEKATLYKDLRPLYALNILGYNAFDDKVFLRKESILQVCHHVCIELSKEFIGTENQKYWYIFLNTGKADGAAPVYIRKAAKFFEDMKKGNKLTREEVLKMNAAQESQDMLYRVREAALDDGRAEGIATIISQFIASGMNIDEIAKIISMPINELEDILRKK